MNYFSGTVLCSQTTNRYTQIEYDRILRIFTQTPWGCPSRRRGYNRRSAVERINNRLDRVFNFETHYIRGPRSYPRSRAHLDVIAMSACSTGSRVSMVSRQRPCISRKLITALLWFDSHDAVGEKMQNKAGMPPSACNSI